MTPLGTPSASKSNPARNKKFHLIYIMHCICENTSFFWLKIFEIDLVIEVKIYLIFWSLPGGGGGDKFVVARPIRVGNSHTEFGWI